jgi:hypothetical protein
MRSFTGGNGGFDERFERGLMSGLTRGSVRPKLASYFLLALLSLTIASLTVAAHSQSSTPPAASASSASTPGQPVTPSAGNTGKNVSAKVPASGPNTVQSPSPNSGGMVWVNTDTGVYHQPGTRYYGKTKQGKYMLEADAIRAGYRAAGKKQ